MSLLDNIRFLMFYLPGLTHNPRRFYDLVGIKHTWGDHDPCLNFGFWRNAMTMDDANEAMFQLVGEAAELKSGVRILDVGCGFGHQCRYWVSRFRVDCVLGLNISAAQVAWSKKRMLEDGFSQQVRFILGSGTCMPFSEGVFDVVIALESAFHFDTRQSFLCEAHRVLKPGGKIVLADIILSPGSGVRSRIDLWMTRIGLQYHPMNMCNRTEYSERLRNAGFFNVHMNSIRNYVFVPFLRYIFSHRETMRRYFWTTRMWFHLSKYFVARKPNQYDYAIISADRS